jgi:hypothetical protein
MPICKNTITRNRAMQQSPSKYLHFRGCFQRPHSGPNWIDFSRTLAIRTE